MVKYYNPFFALIVWIISYATVIRTQADHGILRKYLDRPIFRKILTTTSIYFLCPFAANSISFPLTAPLKNNIALVRAGECFADSRHEIQTNPVKKLRQDNALTMLGREQAVNAAKELKRIGFYPTFIWASNTERAYETAAVIAVEDQLGQNRIVPEYSFLDARAVGMFEGSTDKTWEVIHRQDTEQGSNYRPPPNSDGTPSDSVSDVLVRANQLISTIDSMYSGENVLIVSPDSEILSIITAAFSDDNPDNALLTHYKYAYQNGEVHLLAPYIKVSSLSVTGQTKDELKAVKRNVLYLRAAGNKSPSTLMKIDNWFDIWHLSVDQEN